MPLTTMVNLSALDDSELKELIEKAHMVLNERAEIDNARQKIIDFANKMGISPESILNVRDHRLSPTNTNEAPVKTVSPEPITPKENPSPSVDVESKKTKPGPKPKSKQVDVSLKKERKALYTNPDDPEQTWSGRGKRPNWLNEKIQQGFDLSDLFTGDADNDVSFNEKVRQSPVPTSTIKPKENKGYTPLSEEVSLAKIKDESVYDDEDDENDDQSTFIQDESPRNSRESESNNGNIKDILPDEDLLESDIY